MAASARGEHDRALAILREAADAERNLGYWEPPHYARPVLESLADAAIRAGRLDTARAAYNEALVLRPDSYHALRGLARLNSKESKSPKKSKEIKPRSFDSSPSFESFD